jgi:hypothetical protein
MPSETVHRASRPHHRPDASEIAAALAARIRPLCGQLLSAGRPKGSYWTCGSVDNERGGSLWVHLSGSRIGRWQDAATGEFGDTLDLVAACMCRGDKKAAYRWASAWLGESLPLVQRNVLLQRARVPDQDADHRRRAALRLYLEAQPSLAGMPADFYLALRGIDLASLGRQPRALRFHPSLPHCPSGGSFPAMIAAISGLGGAHIATHRTWLQQDHTGAWTKARIEDPKMTLGAFGGGLIRLWRGLSGKALRDADADEMVVIGEGIETCLSIALACPELRVLAAVSLGNMGSIALPPQLRRIILAADNDPKPKARAALQRVIERHLDAGRDVHVARSVVGKDFNDALRAWSGCNLPAGAA